MASPPDATQAGESRRILVVDDNVDAAELLRELLSFLGHEVAVAHDGATALELAGEFHPDIALLDIGMPVMNGSELATHLRRAEGAQRSIRLVAVTGFAAEQISAADSFDHHLVKPFDVDKLRQVIAAGPRTSARGGAARGSTPQP